MSVLNVGLSDEERKRNEDCVQEPIRTPGTVQSHGALIAIDSETFEIVVASANTGQIIGVEPSALLGQPVMQFTGPESLRAIKTILSGDVVDANPVLVTIGERGFDVIVHRAGRLAILEFEPSSTPADFPSASMLYASIHRLARAATINELWAGAARELQRLTGFDRVMVNFFHPDGHGEIVAEEASEGMEPYLGLHYPASDIPAQARDLYLTKLSRVIASSADENAPLLSDRTPSALDLSQAELRSVSPHHLQFMRNMGQASTMSFSLIHNDELVGMITCAHRTPRRLPFLLRRGLEILANQVALQLNSMREIERLTRQAQIASIRVKLVGQLAKAGNMADALLHRELTVLDLVPADGAMLTLNGQLASIGTVPSVDETAALVEHCRASGVGATLVTDALSVDHPDLAALMPSVAGVLLMPLGGEGDYIAWYRSEISRTVNWLGDQSSTNRKTPLSPRNSFSAWSQTVTGTAASWDGLELEAAELCRDLDRALLHRAESKLAGMALRDGLTGLPNRRLLMDRLEHALAKYARGEELALLFIDLDGFKAINDSSGHLVGDAVIVHAGQRILASTRTQDTVARLGGDEFVVLCENTTPEEADHMAARIVRSIGQPTDLNGRALRITASIGVTAANLSFSALDLIREADAAMYRAKARGRNQASR